jgi:hypothetical protein
MGNSMNKKKIEKRTLPDQPARKSGGASAMLMPPKYKNLLGNSR